MKTAILTAFVLFGTLAIIMANDGHDTTHHFVKRSGDGHDGGHLVKRSGDGRHLVKRVFDFDMSSLFGSSMGKNGQQSGIQAESTTTGQVAWSSPPLPTN